ncbi:hypothetical protein KDL44_02850 [bacterium]|nr:hypothetical protein [bacterium]
MDDNIQRIADDVRNVTSHGDELAFQHGGVITVRNLTDGSQRNFDLSKWLPTTSESGSANGVQQLFISDTSILLDAELDKVQILMDRESEDTNTRPTRPLSEFKEYLLVGDSVLGVTNSIAQTSELEVTLWDGEQTLSTVFFHESGVGPNWPYFKHDPGGHYIYFADNVTYDWATNQSGLLLDGAERVLGNVYDPVSQRNWCWADGRIVNFMGGQQEVFARVSDDGAFLWVTYPWLLCVDKEMLRQYDIRSGELVRNLTMDVAEPAIWAMDGVLLENGSCYLNYFQKGVWKLPAMSAE